jgi:hypothetical protein
VVGAAVFRLLESRDRRSLPLTKGVPEVIEHAAEGLSGRGYQLAGFLPPLFRRLDTGVS